MAQQKLKAFVSQCSGFSSQKKLSMSDTFSTLQVFQEAHKLTLKVYKITSTFPEDEKYALISQIRRAAASVPANIVEGQGRSGKQEKIHFLYIANGSLEEVKYFLLLAKDLNYITPETYNVIHDDANSVGKLLQGFITYMKVKHADN